MHEVCERANVCMHGEMGVHALFYTSTTSLFSHTYSHHVSLRLLLHMHVQETHVHLCFIISVMAAAVYQDMNQ